MRITSKGQVTIPVDIRARAGLMPNTEVVFEIDGTAVRIVPVATPRKPTRGARLVAHLRRHGGLANRLDRAVEHEAGARGPSLNHDRRDVDRRPRRCGSASHLGALSGLPTGGAAVCCPQVLLHF
jgi:AbrB family looped-hinge helix DNA binding protein